MEPWGTPILMSLVKDEVLLKVTNCFLQGVKKVPNPKQNYIGLMTEG